MLTRSRKEFSEARTPTAAARSGAADLAETAGGRVFICPLLLSGSGLAEASRSAYGEKNAGEVTMLDFGYFTLSDNHYDNNARTANQLIADILDEAVYAEEVGLHSAWIGEHHFSTLGVLSCPDLVLAQVAARARVLRQSISRSMPGCA